MNKFEKLIEYVINEDEAKAEELFHEIVVEKSRDIYESLMDQDNFGGDEADELVNDIAADEEGMREDDDMDDMGGEEMSQDFDMSGDMDDHEMDHVAGDDEDAELEDRVVDLEDQLDSLMAEFDALMNGDEAGMDDMGGEEEFSMDADMDDMGAEEEMPMESADEEVTEDDALEEAVSLTKVTKGIAGTTEGESVGAGNESTNVNTKTINNDNAGAKGAAAKPHQKVGEESGRAAPTAQDMGSTTEPNESKVKEPKKKGEDASVNKTSVAKQNRS